MGLVIGYDLMDTILPILGIDSKGQNITKVVLTMDKNVATVDITRFVDLNKSPELLTKRLYVTNEPRGMPTVIKGRDLEHIHTEIIKKGL